MGITNPKPISVKVQIHSLYCGERLRSLKIPPKCHVLGIVREEQFISITQDPIIADQDFIIAVATDAAYQPLLQTQLLKTRQISWQDHDQYFGYCKALI